MLKQISDKVLTETAVIKKSTYESVLDLFEAGEIETAHELAVSILEAIFTGQITSTNTMVKIALNSDRAIWDNERTKWLKNKEIKQQKRLDEMQLEQIAEWKRQGLTQREMGERLGISQQAVGKRLTIIQTDFPELLQPD